MFVKERLEIIMSLLKEKGKIEVNDLSKQFNVSKDLIRKDLQKLEDQGLRKFGAIIKINKLKKNVPNIGLERPLLIYASFRMVLTTVTEVSGCIKDSETDIEYASASFNVIEI